MEQHTAPSPVHCATCGAVLQGKFCHDCGEKKLDHLDGDGLLITLNDCHA